MKISKLISATQTNFAASENAQPEWTCVIELEDGTRRSIERVMQWNKPQAHHLQDELDRFPTLFAEVYWRNTDASWQPL